MVIGFWSDGRCIFISNMLNKPAVGRQRPEWNYKVYLQKDSSESLLSRQQTETNKQKMSWLLMLSWAFKNPARMRLETQPRLWIIDLEQPKTDALKGQDILLAFSLGYNPHPDNITSAPFRSSCRHFLAICVLFSANLCVMVLLMDYTKERYKVKNVSLM